MFPTYTRADDDGSYYNWYTFCERINSEYCDMVRNMHPNWSILLRKPI